MRDVVVPLRLVVVDSVRDRHPELAVVRREDEAVRSRGRLLREQLLEPGVRLRRRVEAAPFNVRTEHEPHLVPHVALPALVARDEKPRRVASVGKRKHERERRGASHAARHEEVPARAAPRGIGREGRHALRVQLARVALALEPAARARPEVEPVGRHVRIRVRGEHRVVLARDGAPSDPHLRRRARSV